MEKIEQPITIDIEAAMAPTQPAPVQPAPVAAAPVQPVAAPVAAAPVQPAPVAAAPVAAAPVAAAPVQPAPVAAAPVQPVAAAPVQPVAAAPVQPVAAAPVQPAPVSAELAELAINVIPATAAEIAATSAEVAAEVAASEDITGSEIASMQAAYWGAFNTLLSLLSTDLGSTDIISINNGKLSLSKEGGVVSADLTDIFGSNTWHILDPKGVIKTLKLIKGGKKVTVMDDGSRNIIYNSESSHNIKTIVTITKPAVDTATAVTTKVDPGERKNRMELSKDVITSLVAAKAALGALYYNIIIDTETFEILSIDIDNKFKENLISSTGRQTARYKVKDLFPIPKPDNMLIETFQNDDQIFIKTLADLTMTTVEFQIKALAAKQDSNYDY